MSVDIYSTHVLAGVIRESKPTLPGFWLNFVSRVYNSDVAEIHFDRVGGLSRKVAPYVMPTVAGKVQRHGGYQTEKFTPAYVKISDTIDPSRTLTRRPGEAYGGQMSPMQRRDALLAEYLQEQRDAVERRELRDGETVGCRAGARHGSRRHGSRRNGGLRTGNRDVR